MYSNSGEQMSYSSPINWTLALGMQAKAAAQTPAPKLFPTLKAPKSATTRARPPGRGANASREVELSGRRTRVPSADPTSRRTLPSVAAHQSAWWRRGIMEHAWQILVLNAVMSSSRTVLSRWVGTLGYVGWERGVWTSGHGWLGYDFGCFWGCDPPGEHIVPEA